MELAQLAAALPKVELHYHLTGAARPATLAYIARNFGPEGLEADEGAIRRQITVEPDCASLNDFLAHFTGIARYFRTPEAWAWAAEQAVREAAGQNILYLELRFAPLLAGCGLPPEQVVEATLRGMAQGSRRYGVPARALVILGVGLPPEQNEEAVRLAHKYRAQGVVGVDVAGPEALFPAKLQAGPLRLARQLGLPITIHAGEAGGPENIRSAVDELGAARIGHATRLWQDPELLQRLARQGVGLELCPTSNYQTQAISGWHEYPIHAFRQAGFRFAVCTDDPAISGIDLNHEYQLVMERFGFTPQQMGQMVHDAIDISFLPAGEKPALHALAQKKLDEVLAVL